MKIAGWTGEVPARSHKPAPREFESHPRNSYFRRFSTCCEVIAHYE